MITTNLSPIQAGNPWKPEWLTEEINAALNTEDGILVFMNTAYPYSKWLVEVLKDVQLQEDLPDVLVVLVLSEKNTVEQGQAFVDNYDLNFPVGGLEEDRFNKLEIEIPTAVLLEKGVIKKKWAGISYSVGEEARFETAVDKLTFFEECGGLVIQEFLEPQLCQEMLAEARQAKLFTSGEVFKLKEYVVDERVRKVQITELSPSTVETVKQKLMAIQPQLEAKFNVKLSELEKPQFLLYREGGFFQVHKDRETNNYYEISPNRRRVSIVIFVNDEEGTDNSNAADINTYQGGALIFYGLSKDEGVTPFMSLSLNGQSGLLVAFDSDVVHQVTPVKVGERMTVVTWFLD